jgi:NADH dehydrogenase (ubiquinone) 1 beta subcomplex subunit 9
MTLTAHAVRIKTLYRQMLKQTYNWYGNDYRLHYLEVCNVRDQFEKARHLKDVGEIETWIRDAEQILKTINHPDPYRPLTNPGGGMYSRNTPLPREFLAPPPAYAADYDYTEEKLF